MQFNEEIYKLNAANDKPWERWRHMNTYVWGPMAWNYLHTLAIEYSADPTDEEARDIVNKIWDFVNNLPCSKCKVHAIEYIQRRSPAIVNTDALQIWAWEFHNHVNFMLQKTRIPYDEYLALYSSEICKANLRIEREYYYDC